MSAHTISVAMTTYNGSAHLDDQLASIAIQTRLPDELVVFDDTSVDDSVARCRRFADKVPFAVRVEVNASRRGAAQNKAAALAACTGSIVVLCDQDDVWRADRLARMEQALLEPGGASLAFSDADLIDNTGRLVGQSLWEEIGFDLPRRANVAEGHAFGELLGRNFVSAPTAVMHASLLPLALPIPPGCWVDAWLALVAAATSGVVAVPDRLVRYRQHGSQQLGVGSWSSRLRRRCIRCIPLQLRARLESQSPMDATLRRLVALQERLAKLAQAGASGPGVHPGCAEAVDDRIFHWRLRSQLPRGPRPRATAIRAEFATGRYHRYSYGARSALADLALPVARRPVVRALDLPPAAGT